LLPTLYGVFAPGSAVAHIVGNTDAVLRTTNEGVTFTSHPQIFPSATDYRGVRFVGTSTGFICGSGKRIAKTTNGGINWEVSYNPGGTGQLWAIDMTVHGKGVAVGANGMVLLLVQME